MVVNLSKGSTVNLSKKSKNGLSKVIVGLGWDPVKVKGGVLSKLFSGGKADIDCDAFCVTLDNNGKEIDTVYFGQLRNFDGNIKHCGDNLTGDGEGDDEQIIMELDRLSPKVQSIRIGVNIYSGRGRGQDFSSIDNAFVRIVDSINNDEMCRYNLSGKEYSGFVTMEFGKLERDENGDWQFTASGEPSPASSIGEFARKFR